MNSFENETILFIILPIVLVAGGGIISLVFYTARQRGRKPKPVKKEDGPMTDQIELIEITGDHQDNPRPDSHYERDAEQARAADSIRKESEMEYPELNTPGRLARNTSVGGAVITLFFLQPTLVKQFALLFSCTRLGSAEGHLFLTQNLLVQCGSGQHWGMILGLGLPLLLLYVIGIPLLLYVILGHNRKHIALVSHTYRQMNQASLTDQNLLASAAQAQRELSKSPKTVIFMKNYAFLFLGYQEETYLWEIVVIARKGLLSIIGVALATDPRGQVMLGLLVTLSLPLSFSR